MREGRLDFCGTAETDGEPLDIALPLLYTATGEFFIRAQDDALVSLHLFLYFS